MKTFNQISKTVKEGHEFKNVMSDRDNRFVMFDLKNRLVGSLTDDGRFNTQISFEAMEAFYRDRSVFEVGNE